MQDQKLQPQASFGPLRWFKGRSLRAQFLLITGLFALAAIILLIIISAQINNLLRENLNDDLSEHSDDIGQSLASQFEALPNDLNIITSDLLPPAVMESLTNRIRPSGPSEEQTLDELASDLKILLNGRPLYSALRIVDTRGQEILSLSRSQRTGEIEELSALELRNRNNDEFFQAGQQLRASGQIWVSEVVLERDIVGRPIEPRKQIMFLVTPLADSTGSPVALLVIDLHIDWAVSLVANRQSSDEVVYVLDDEGYYVAAAGITGAEGLLYGRSTSIGERLTGDLASDLLSNTPQEGLNYRLSGTNYIGSTAIIQPLRPFPGVTNQPTWTVVVSQESGAVATSTRFLIGGFAIAFAVILIIAGAAFWYAANQVSQRFGLLSNALTRVNRGDLGIKLPTEETNEFGQVATLFNSVTERTQSLVDDLQSRVQARIRDLDLTAEISREIAGLRDQNLVLNRTINRVIEQFDYYHAQVFLVDDLREYAVLVASTGEAGQRLLAKKHKLAVGSNSVIGRVTALGVTVIAGDTTSTEVPWQPNIELPNTRSEMALPLKVEDEVIGALDVQSIRPEAYSPEDIEVFQVLADQLAIAINNARLIEELEQRVEEVALLNRRLTEKAWEEYAKSQPEDAQLGYQYNLIGVRAVDAAENGNQDVPASDDKSYSTAITVGGKSIGHIEALAPDRAQLSKDEQSLVDAVASRVALAVDNARLFQQTQLALGESQRLYEMARTVSSAAELNVDAVYSLITDQLTYYDGLDSVAVLLAEPYPSHLAPNVSIAHLWTRSGLMPTWELGQRLPLLQQGLSAQFETAPRSPVIINAKEVAENGSNQVLPYLLRSLSAETIFLMPLVSGAKWFGLLVGSSFTANAFTESFITFTSAVADQLAIAVENRRLLEEVQKEARRALALADAGQLASRISTDFEDDVNRLFRAVSEPGDFDRWWFGVLDFDGQSLRHVAAFSPQEADDVPYMPQRLNLKRDRNAITEAVLVRQVVLVNERQHPIFGKLSAQEHIVYGKHLALPVMTSNEVVIGALLIGRRTSQPDLDERDIQLATTLASQLAIATENQRLFAAVESQRQTLQSTLEAMPAGVLLLAPRGNSLLSNQRAIDLLGGGVNKALFSSATYPLFKVGTNEPYSPDEFPTAIALRENTLVSAENISVEYPDGRRIDLLANAAPIRDENGDIISVVAVFQEITELRELEKALQESLSETTALYEANRQISAATNINEIANVLVNQLLSMMPNQVYVVLQEGIDRGPLTTRVVAAWPESYAGVTDVDLLALPRNLLMTEEPLVVSNVEQSIGFVDQELEFNLRLQAIQSGLQSFASIPLRARGRTLGWFAVVYFDKHSFMAEDRRFMTTLADQTALALDGIFLFQSTQDALRAVANLYRSSRRIAEARDLEDVIETIRAELLNFNPDRIDLLLQRSQEDIETVYLGLEWSKDPSLAQTPSLPVERGVGKPLHNFDALSRDEYYIQSVYDEEAAANELAIAMRSLQTPYQAILSVPLSVGGRVVGRVAMGFRDSQIFTPDEYQFITTLADAAAYLVENDLLFKQTQESLEETGVLYQASRAIANAEKREEIVQAVIDYAADAAVDKVFLLTLRTTDWDSYHAELEVATSWGREELVNLQGLRLSREQLPFWDDLATAKIMWVDDVVNDPNLSENARLGYKVLSIGSFVIVPLRTPTRLIGAILLASSSARFHQDREIRIYQSLADLAAVQLENKRLFEQTELRARQLTTSAEVSRAATSILNLDELFPRVVDLIRESFQYDHVQVFMVDETGENAVLRASTGEAGRQLLQNRHSLPIGSVSVIGQTTSKGIPVLVPDTALSETHRANPLLPDTRSEIAFPLVVKGRVVGALDVQSNQAGLFTEEDVQALTTMADQLAVAIDNAQLFEISQQRAAEMAFLFDVTTFAAAMPTMSSMLETVSQVLASRMNASSVVFFLTETGRNRLAAQAMVIAIAEGDSNTYHSIEPSMKVTIGEGLAGHVAETHAPFIVNAFEEGGLYTPADISARSAIYLPLLSGENLIGVMGVEGQRPSQFDEDALRLLQTLSTAIAAVIQNTLLVEELQRTNDQLREIDQLKTNFLAAMSHELRTPLNSIIGFSRVILKGIDGPINDMQKQDIQTIHESGKHLLGLVNDILDQAKIEAGKMELSPDYFELAPVIKGVMASAIGLTRDKPIRLYTEVEDDLPKTYGDEFRTRQILFNLISNATKFTYEGSVTLSAYVDKSLQPPMLLISVRDTGIGIPAEHMDNIFEAFQQIDNSTTRSAEGTGLGLPLSRSLAELQGGRLWVESEAGVGSTFYVTIPLQPPPPEIEEMVLEEDTFRFGEAFHELVDEIKAERPAPQRQKIILAIDDELGMINLYRRYLSKEGWQVIGLTNSAEAEEMVATHHPMIILLDINMPNRDGWQVLEKLKDKDETYSIPVVVCSINNDTQRSYRLGATQHLVKPFVETDLIKTVREIEATLAS